MNRREWVLYGQKELEEAQIENASGDAWYLFSECFHISREDYLFGMTDEINDQEAHITRTSFTPRFFSSFRTPSQYFALSFSPICMDKTSL